MGQCCLKSKFTNFHNQEEFLFEVNLEIKKYIDEYFILLKEDLITSTQTDSDKEIIEKKQGKNLLEIPSQEFLPHEVTELCLIALKKSQEYLKNFKVDKVNELGILLDKQVNSTQDVDLLKSNYIEITNFLEKNSISKKNEVNSHRNKIEAF